MAKNLRIWSVAAAILALGITTHVAQAKVVQPPGLSCDEAIEEAAHTTQVPPRLLAAIGLVETGRQDPLSGTWRPWPWAINAEGAGFYFNSKVDAIAAVRTLQANGVRSIDIGCMQVNLMHHPDAFATLEEAFDPRHNALYAGRFLDRLFQRCGDWIIAAGWYHSGTANLAAEYARKVSANLPGGKPGPVVRSGGLVLKTALLVDRDGMILPSVRLTASGLVPVRVSAPVQAHLADRYFQLRVKPGRLRN